MYKLLIDGIEAELNEDTKIQLSYLVLDITDLSKRGVVVTNSINLPNTVINNRVLGYPLRISTNSTSFEVEKTYSLYSGNQIISEGGVTVKDADPIKGIKIQLSEGRKFWDSISSDLLSSLDLFDDYFAFSIANLQALESKGGSVFVPGFSRGRNDASYGDYVYNRPSFWSRNIVEKIINQAGYEVDWTNVLTNTEADNVGFMSNAQKFYVSDYATLFEEVEMSIGQVPLTSSVLDYSVGGNVTIVSESIQINTYKTAIALKGLVRSNFMGEITVSHVQSGGTKTERILISKGDNKISFKTGAIEVGSVVTISTNIPCVFESVRVLSLISESDVFDVVGSTHTGLNNTPLDGLIVVSDFNLPEISQKDLLKSFIKMFFLKVDTNDISKKLTFSHFPDVLSTNNALDISDKVQKDGTFTTGGLYGQLNALTYSNDKDVSESEGSSYFSINNFSSAPVKSFLEIKEFSSSKEVLFKGRNVIQLDIYGGAERIVVKDRIVYYSLDGGLYNFRMLGVDWSNLYADNYTSFVESTSAERAIKKKALLTNLDFRKIKDNPIVYIAEYKSNFLVTEINGFESGEMCELSLIKYL